MISFGFIGTLLLLGVEHKVDKTMNTMEIMTDIIEDLGDTIKKLSEDMKNKIPYQDAKLVDDL